MHVTLNLGGPGLTPIEHHIFLGTMFPNWVRDVSCYLSHVEHFYMSFAWGVKWGTLQDT